LDDESSESAQLAEVLPMLLEKLNQHPSFASLTLTDTLNYAKAQKLPELTEYEKQVKALGAQVQEKEEESVIDVLVNSVPGPNKVDAILRKSQQPLDQEDPLHSINVLLTKMLLAYLDKDILPKARDEFEEAQRLLREQREEELRKEREMKERERMQREKEMKRRMLKEGKKGAQQVGGQEESQQQDNDSSSQATNGLEPKSPTLEITCLPYPTPKKYILLMDFPKNIFQVRHLQEESINFDCLVGLIAQKKNGPPPPLPQYQKQEEETPSGKGGKDTKSKKDSSKKDAKKGGAPATAANSSPPLYNQLQTAQHHLSQCNVPSFLRSPLFVPLTFNVYEYTDDMQELNTGNDLDYETNRLVKLLEESLSKVASAHRDYYNAVQQNQFVPIERGIEDKDSVSLLHKRKRSPPPAPAVSSNYYHTLMNSIPSSLVSVPLLTYCLMEQVVKNVEMDEGAGEHSDNSFPQDDFVPDDKKLNVNNSQIEDELDTLFDSFHRVNEEPPAVAATTNAASEEQDGTPEDQNSVDNNNPPDSPLSDNRRRPSHLSVGMNNPPTYEPYEGQPQTHSPFTSKEGPPVVEYGDKLSLRKTKHVLLGETLFDIEMEMLTKLDIFPRQSSQKQLQLAPEQRPQDDTSTTAAPLSVPDITSVAERGSRLTELHNFMGKDERNGADQNTQKYSLSMKQLQKELALFKFEELLQAQRKLENGASTKTVDFSDRTFQEDFSREAFIQVLASHASSLGTSCSVHAKPHLYSSYYDLEDAALLIYAQNVDESGNKFSSASSFSKLFEIPAYYGEFQQERQIQFVNDLQNVFTDLLEKHHAEIEEKRLQAKLEAEAKERRKRERRQKALKDKESSQQGATEEGDKERINEPSADEENSPNTDDSAESTSASSPIALHTCTPKRTLLSESSNQSYFFVGSQANLHHESLQFYPNDGALIHLYSYNNEEKLAAANASLRVNFRVGCSVFKDGVHFGFKAHCTRAPQKERTFARTVQDGYFTATFEDDTCLTALGSEGTSNKRASATLNISTKSGLFVQQSFESGEILQILNPQSNSRFVPAADYISSFAAKRTFIGSGYKQLVRNALHNMSAFLSRDDEPLQVWNPERNSVETVLGVEKYRIVVPESFCLVRHLDAVVPPSPVGNSEHAVVNLVQILYSNGETAVYHSTHKYWLKTLHDGSRFVFPRDAAQDAAQQIDSVNCSTNIDSETGAQVYTREDFVMQIIYSDNRTRFVQFTDGSRIWTHEKELSATAQDSSSAEDAVSQIVLFEHPHFASVEVDSHSLNSSVEIQGVCLSERNPQTQSVQFQKDAHEFVFSYAAEEENVVVRLASRYFYEKHNKVQLNPLYGVYLCNYGFSSKKQTAGGLKCIDLEGNEFMIQSTGRSMIRYRNPVNPLGKDRSLTNLDVLLGAQIAEFTHAEQQDHFLQVCTLGKPKSVAQSQKMDPQSVHARLFMLRRYDGSGCEYISEVQAFPYIEAGKSDNKTEFSEDHDPTMNLSALSFLTEVHDQSASVLAIKDRPLPQALLPLKMGGSSRTNSHTPLGHLHRRFVTFPAIEDTQRTQMKESYEKWKNWHTTRERMQDRLQQENEAQQAMSNEENPVKSQIEKHIQEKVLPQLEQQESVYAAEMSEVATHDTPASGHESLDENVAGSVESDEDAERPSSALGGEQHFQGQAQKIESILNTSKTLESPVRSQSQSPMKSPTVNYWQTMNGSEVLNTLRSTKTVEEQELDEMLSLHKTMSPARRKLPPLSASPQQQALFDEQPAAVEDDARSIERNLNNVSRISQASSVEEFDDEGFTDGTVEESSRSPQQQDTSTKTRRNIPPRIHIEGSEQDGLRYTHKQSLRSFNNSPSVYSSAMSQYSPNRRSPSPGMSGNALEVYPSSIDFGLVAPNRIFTTQFLVTNVGATPCRFVLKYRNSRSKPLSANLNQTGPLSGGLNRKVILKLDTSKISVGESIDDAVHIKYSGGVLTVPVSGKVVPDGLSPNHLNRKNSQIKDLGSSRGELSMHR